MTSTSPRSRHANRSSFLLLAVVVLAPFCLLPRARAQNPAQPADSIEAIDAIFQNELRDLERRRLERLAALAASQKPADAVYTYGVYFQSALTGSLFKEAEPVAERVLASKEFPPSVRFLADLVNIIAEVDRNDFEASLKSVERAAALARELAAANAGETLPLNVRIGLIDRYIHRLIQANHPEIAQRALAILSKPGADPGILETANGWANRIALLGKPAPPIKGTDVDGKPFDLAAFKGDPVLVVFWASWCLPNAEQLAEFTALEAKYRAQGFHVVGINMDSSQSDAPDPATLISHIQHLRLDANIQWPSLLNGKDDADFAKAYAVQVIPANYLIGRDGNIAQLDLVPANLEASIKAAVAR